MSPRQRLTSPKAYGIYAGVLIALVSVGAVYVTYLLAGLFDTIIYVLLFVFSLTLLPIFVNVFGSVTPNLLNKGHLILGALAYGRMVLVQFEDRFELCPATYDRVYIDGEWHNIEGGHTNWSVLGWRPFGMIRYKEEGSLSDIRADVRGEINRGATTDGGSVSRGNFTEVRPPGVSGDEGKWLIDLKRVFTKGVREIGNIDMIETAEEITERKNAQSNIGEGWKPIIASAIGILIGVITGVMVA